MAAWRYTFLSTSRNADRITGIAAFCGYFTAEIKCIHTLGAYEVNKLAFIRPKNKNFSQLCPKSG